MFRKILITLVLLLTFSAAVLAETEGELDYDAGAASDEQAKENDAQDSETTPSTVQNTPPSVIGGKLLPGTQDAVEQEIDKDIQGWFQSSFLSKIITTLIGWTAALAVVMILIGAYQHLTAAGNEERVKQGNKTITFGLVGVVLALLAFAIVQILINFDFGGAKADLLAADVVFENEIDQVVPFYDSESGNWSSEGNEEVAALPQSDFRNEFLPIIARIMIYGIGSVAFMVFFGAGVWLVIGWGEEESIKKAKNVIIMAITAMAFAAGSYILVKSLLEIDIDLQPKAQASFLLESE